MNRGQKQDLAAIAITCAFFSLPVVSAGMQWLYFLIPLPVVYLLITLGNEQGARVIGKAALAAGLLAILFKVLPVMIFSFSLIPMGLVLAHSIRRQETPAMAGLKAVATITGAWLLLGSMLGSGDRSLYQEILRGVDQLMVAALENYRQSAQVDPATLMDLEAAFAEKRQMVGRIFPGIMVMTTICTVWLNLVLADWLLKKKQADLSPWPSFREWRLPEALVWAVIFSGGSLFLPNEALNTLALNTLLVLGVIYFIQGLAVMVALLSRWTIPGPLKFFIYLLFVIQGASLLAVLGLADVWIDFRKRKPNTEQDT